MQEIPSSCREQITMTIVLFVDFCCRTVGIGIGYPGGPVACYLDLCVRSRPFRESPTNKRRAPSPSSRPGLLPPPTPHLIRSWLTNRQTLPTCHAMIKPLPFSTRNKFSKFFPIWYHTCLENPKPHFSPCSVEIPRPSPFASLRHYAFLPTLPSPWMSFAV